MMSHRWRYKGRGSVLIRFFTSSTVRCAAARVILAIPSLFCFQSSPPLFYHSTRIGIKRAQTLGNLLAQFCKVFLQAVNMGELLPDQEAMMGREASLECLGQQITLRTHTPT